MGNRSLGASCASRRVAAGLSTLLAAGLALAASPALSQGAMGPGGGAMTPQPRVAPPPPAPVAPPPAPVVAPQMPIVAPSINQPVPQPQTRSATSTSNRDHIDQDAQTDIKKLTTSGGSSTGSPGGAQKTIRVINNSESERANTPGAPTVPANPVANNSNQPIPSVNVMVRKQSGAGPISTAKTDGSGQTTFRQLEPGTYDVALPSVAGGTVSMTTFVNGTPVGRTDFPMGSEIGTFTVAKASDTVILKFQTNLGTTPVNGIGGLGGGRFQTNGAGGMGGGRYTFK
ncbi:carboxypeptidase-like regulatory domain-containing protein [Reyranella sp.]|uniref:carboxypeptidase-like regulatory domain-containing protein n=1 Tax=Reyranella sp. TaxID=1929291 RepID=UPI003F6E616D